MSTSSSSPASGYAQTTRILAATFMGTLVIIGIAISQVLSPPWSLPPIWVIAVQVVLGVVLFMLVNAVGFRAPAVPRDATPDEAAGLARSAFQNSMFVRFVLCESLAIISLALAFVIREGGGFPIYAIGAVVSLALMAWLAFPSARVVRRFEAELDRDGGRSGLGEAFGLGAEPGGAIQQL